jgi:hypothetical protein
MNQPPEAEISAKQTVVSPAASPKTNRRRTVDAAKSQTIGWGTRGGRRVKQGLLLARDRPRVLVLPRARRRRGGGVAHGRRRKLRADAEPSLPASLSSNCSMPRRGAAKRGESRGTARRGRGVGGCVNGVGGVALGRRGFLAEHEAAAGKAQEAGPAGLSVVAETLTGGDGRRTVAALVLAGGRAIDAVVRDGTDGAVTR